ncbi:MAG: serine/threonine protein kinase [Deltaproteobacteria bacterium]|nr:serine/threonine protein kinase [Deltaproteobacteria bacterium]
MTAPASERPPLSTGTVIAPDLTVVRRLGLGGQAEVYEVVDPDGARYAAKIQLAELAGDSSFAARLSREAASAAAVHHPNVVEVYRVETSPDGRLVVVMELLLGRPLTQVLRHGRIPVDRALDLALGIARGLEAIHAVGIIHRDLKPANIFLADGPEDTLIPKLTDFGIAKVGKGWEATQLTQTGALLGTPAYMSPEQIERPDSLDARSDHYSFGVVLFEMLAGRPPFISDQVGQILMQHVRAQPPSPRAFAPEVPQPIAAFVLRALDKHPDRRFANTAELIRRLEVARHQDARRPNVLDGKPPPDLVPTQGLLSPDLPKAPVSRNASVAKAVQGPSLADAMKAPRVRKAAAAAAAAVVLMFGARVAWVAYERANAPIIRWAVVTSDPPGAEILLDGEPALRTSGEPHLTPARVKLDGKTRHEIVVVKPGIGEEQFTVEAAGRDAPDAEIRASFKDRIARVKIVAPSSAVITVNGVRTQETTVDVKPGTAVIEARYGTSRCSDRVEIIAPVGSEQTVELKPQCGGYPEFDWP